MQGTYYVGAYVDSHTYHTESNENNNANYDNTPLVIGSPPSTPTGVSAEYQASNNRNYISWNSVETVTVYNDGYADLSVTDIDDDTSNPIWIDSFSKTSITVTPGDSPTFTFNINPANLAIGSYFGNVIISSNDPDESSLKIPVSLTVIPKDGLADTPWPMCGRDLRHTRRSNCVGKDGTLKWQHQTGSDVYPSSVIDADGTIYVGSGDNYFYAINSDGTRKWQHQTGDVTSSPAIGSDGTIYVGSNDNYLYAINSDGTRKWRYQAGGSVTSSPAISDDGVIYVGSTDGYLYAISPDGTRKWRYQTGGGVGSSPLPLS